MILGREASTPARSALRLSGWVFFLGLAVSAALMVLTGIQLREAAIVDTNLFGLTIFAGERSQLEGGSTVALRPGPGLALILVVLPALAALYAGFRAGRRAP
jgi:hypothetical protein